MVEITDKNEEYIKIRNKNGVNVFEHRYIWEQHNGEIPKMKVIHHKNNNKKDNRIENLECLDIKEHGLIHRKSNRKRIKYASGNVKVIKTNG